MYKYFAAALIGLSCATHACAQETPQSGGILTVALSSDVRTLEPGGQRDFNTDMVTQQVFEGLVAFKADLSVGPALAQSWAVSPDGREYRFKLREGIVFHNGKPVTASDVVWSWEALWKQPAWSCRQNFDGTSGPHVVAVESEGTDTVVFKLAAPSGMLLKQMANIPCSIVVWSPNSKASDGSFTPIGTGPLKLKEWRRDQFVSLERFGAYKPSEAAPDGLSGKRTMLLDEVRFQIIPDVNVATAALQSGAVDILPNPETDQIQDLHKNGITVLSTPGLTWHMLSISLQDPLLKDKRIRQAIAHAVDARKVAEASIGDLTEPSFAAISPITTYFDESFKQWPSYDPKKASEILKSSSYKGEPIRIQTSRSRNKLFSNAIIIQQMLLEAGFNAQLDVMDWSTQLSNYLIGKFQLQTYSFAPRMDPATIYATFLRDSKRLKSSLWDDPKALAILADSMDTNDETRRKADFVQLHGMMQAELPLIPLYFEPVVLAVRPHIRGLKPWAGGSLILNGVWKAR